LWQIVGQEKIFGWILTGPVPAEVSKSISSFSTQVAVCQKPALEDQLIKFWEVKDLPANVPKESDTFYKQKFQKTTWRDKCGRYVVTLPFREPQSIQLGH